MNRTDRTINKMTRLNILIADSGSTKTDWALGQQCVQTQGINPVHQDEAVIRAILSDELLPQLNDAEAPLAVRFYGSGVRRDLEPMMVKLLKEAFPQTADIQARSDLYGAAVALCGHAEGIACILGTGSNSCLYDGQSIVENTPPLGYVLGDEGSGAVLGIRFLNALYKNRLSSALRQALEQELSMSLPDIITRVYRQPLANRWLASLSPFIHRHLADAGVHELVVGCFRDFINSNIDPYQRPDLPVSAVGSVAFHYQEQLNEALDAEGYTAGRILKSPMEGLILEYASL
jgi:N-acetylglucosamine kinase-like BadF-type ATPase